MAFDGQTFGAFFDEVANLNISSRVRAILSSATGTLASGTITYAANPTDNLYLTINGKVYKFSSDMSVPDGEYKVDIKATADLSWSELVTVINATDTEIRASIDTGTDVVTITAIAGGTEGDAITMVDGDTGETFSGATLGSGAGGVTPTIHIW
jgi:predicted heme/steroid binding protein